MASEGWLLYGFRGLVYFTAYRGLEFYRLSDVLYILQMAGIFRGLGCRVCVGEWGWLVIVIFLQSGIS